MCCYRLVWANDANGHVPPAFPTYNYNTVNMNVTSFWLQIHELNGTHRKRNIPSGRVGLARSSPRQNRPTPAALISPLLFFIRGQRESRITHTQR